MEYQGVTGAIVVTLFLVLVVLVVMAGGRGRLTDARLIMLGIFLGVAALLYGTLIPSGGAVQVSGGPAGMMTYAGAGQLAGLLMRLAFVLVLGGLAGSLFDRVELKTTTVAAGSSDVP